MHLNILKARDNGFVTNLNLGDQVRIDDTAMFKKGTESKWSIKFTWSSQPAVRQ